MADVCSFCPGKLVKETYTTKGGFTNLINQVLPPKTYTYYVCSQCGFRYSLDEVQKAGSNPLTVQQED